MDNDRRSILVSKLTRPQVRPSAHGRSGRNLKPHRPPDHIDWDADCPGLGIRIRGSTGDGTWVVQWRERGLTRRRSLGAVHELIRDDARALALEMMGHVAPKQAPLPPLLVDFVPIFLADCAGRWRPSTLTSVTRLCRRQLIPQLGGRRIHEITRADVLMWFDALRSCQNWSLSALSSLMVHAEMLGHRHPNTNPCAGLRRKKTGFKARYPDADAYRKLGVALNLHLKKADGPAIQAIQFLALTGARRGEALALRWDHVQSDRIVLPDSKTGPKTIWMPGPVKTLLDSVPRGDSPFVFGPPDRAQMLRRLMAVWAAVRVRVGSRYLRLHDLRHGYASVAVLQGAELKAIAGLLGHSDFATTMGYAHLRQEHIALAAERVSSRLSKALKPPPPKPATEAAGRRPFSKAYLQYLSVLLKTDPDPADPIAPTRTLTMEEEIEMYYAMTLTADEEMESPREFCNRRGIVFTDFRTSLRHYRDQARASHATAAALPGTHS